MAEPVKVDMKLPILAVIAGLAASIAAFYAVKTDLALVQAKAQATQDEVHKLKQDTENSRDRMNSVVQDLRISIIRVEAGSRRIEDKLDELIGKKNGK